jgi:hypothetical protein
MLTMRIPDPYAKPSQQGESSTTSDEEKRWSQGSWASSSSFPHSPITPTSLYEDAYGSDDDGALFDDDDDDDAYGYGWGGTGGGGWFRKGLGRLSWAGVGSTTTPGEAEGNGEEEGYPSAGDLARNFDQEEEDDSGSYAHNTADASLQDSFTSDDLSDDADDPLYPGIYRALFAFEPEGTAEVGLREDQLVRVVKRGGGVGWAVVEVGWRAGKELVSELRESGELDEEEGGNEDEEGAEERGGEGGVEVELADGRKIRQGLVPESYLAPVRLDGWVDCS